MGVITGAVINITAKRGGTGAPVTIGRAMGLSVQETYRVVPVYGIGSLVARELPVLQYAGAFTMQQFAFSENAVKNLMDQFDRPAAAAGVDGFINTLLFQTGVDVTVTYKRTATETPGLMLISGAVCQTESITIQENSIALRDGSFLFARPISQA